MSLTRLTTGLQAGAAPLQWGERRGVAPPAGSYRRCNCNVSYFPGNKKTLIFNFLLASFKYVLATFSENTLASFPAAASVTET